MAAVAALLLLFGFSATPAFANAVASTSPTVGSVLTVAPNAVSVTATGSLLDQGNSMMVTDPSGNEVDDGSLTISDTTAVIGLKPLTDSGIYTVTYSLLSATDAPLTGSFTFLFNAPSTLSSPSATPTQSATGTTTSKPVKPAGTSSSATIAVIVLFVVATLVALFLLWYARMILIDTRKQKRRKKRSAPAKKSQE